MSMKNWPNAVLRPHRYSSTKPQTVKGAKTMGMVKMESKMFFALCEMFKQKYAASKPKTKMTMIRPWGLERHP